MLQAKTGPTCVCGKQLTSRNSTKQAGKKYFACSGNQQQQHAFYFIWEEDWKQYGPVPKCERHRLPSTFLKVKKPGPNTGRGFWKCSLEKPEQCNFFLWAKINFSFVARKSRRKRFFSKNAQKSDFSPSLSLTLKQSSKSELTENT